MVGPSIGWDRQFYSNEVPPDARPLTLAQRPDADVVVIQRPGRAHWAETIPLLQAAGVRVVVDVDDDFDSIPKSNVACRDYDPRVNPRHNRDWIRRACELADLVTVTTPHLSSVYGRHGRVAVLPNLVPSAYLSIQPSDPLENTIGWAGSVDTHPGDLEMTGTAVQDTLDARPGWSVHVVGTGKGVPQRLKVTQVTATGHWLPFGAYAPELARLSLGIVPLQRSRFNRGKSALKMSELASVGVPVVASLSPDNQRLHDLGVGLLADSPGQWREHLGLLAGSEEAREDLAGRGRIVMATQTYERHCGRWWDAWQQALSRRSVA